MHAFLFAMLSDPRGPRAGCGVGKTASLRFCRTIYCQPRAATDRGYVADRLTLRGVFPRFTLVLASLSFLLHTLLQLIAELHRNARNSSKITTALYLKLKYDRIVSVVFSFVIFFPLFT